MCALQQNREQSRLLFLLNNSTVREKSLFITWEGSEDFGSVTRKFTWSHWGSVIFLYDLPSLAVTWYSIFYILHFILCWRLLLPPFPLKIHVIAPPCPLSPPYHTQAIANDQENINWYSLGDDRSLNQYQEDDLNQFRDTAVLYSYPQLFVKKINSNAPTNDDCDANVTLCLPHINKTLCLIRYYQVITALVSLYFRILANYIVWNVIQDEVSFLSKPYRKARTQYRERVLGSKGQKKRWKTCVTFTNELLGDILGSAYVEHHFSNSSKKMVRKESYLILLQAQN